MPDALQTQLRTFLAKHWRENEADLLFCNKVGKPMVRNKVNLKLFFGDRKLENITVGLVEGYRDSPSSFVYWSRHGAIRHAPSTLS
jgi:hypothetical protein